MKFVLEIELGNDAMRGPWDITATVKDSLKRQLRHFREGDEGTLRDINGNTVGKWEVK